MEMWSDPAQGSDHASCISDDIATCPTENYTTHNAFSNPTSPFLKVHKIFLNLYFPLLYEKMSEIWHTVLLPNLSFIPKVLLLSLMGRNTCFFLKAVVGVNINPTKPLMIRFSPFWELQSNQYLVLCVAGYIHLLLRLTKWFIIAISL